MSEYDNVARGSLKLKGVSDHKIKKKKKKKDKERELSKMYENIASHSTESAESETPKTVQVDKRTKAEIAFEKSKEKKREQQIIERASKTHKERIMEFNKHLDSLTEHFDIPKVSWTK